MDDVDALFTNLPLDETIDIFMKKLFKTLDALIKGISKNDFRNLPNLAAKDYIFTFIKNFYIQVERVVMGSPLGPILTNIFLSHHEENWLNNCPTEFKPSFYISYVDDIFFFESLECSQSFREYMSSKHQNINFTVEQEEFCSLLYLDIKICRKNLKFVTSVYRM